MKKIITLTTCMTFISLLTFAQYSNATNKQDSVIKMVPDGRHFLYTIGGKLVTPQDVANALKTYQPSAIELQKTKQNAVAGFTCLGVSSVSSILALVEFARDNKVANTTLSPDGNFVTTNRSKAGAIVLTSVAVGTGIAAIICLVKASIHSKRSMELYNQHF